MDDRGEKRFATVRYVDFLDSTKNDWLAASQVWIAGDLYRRRADTVLFVNGIPLVLAEFKEPNRPVKAAFDENLTDYRDTIPQLFVPNGFVICSNGSEAKVGSTYAPWEFFGDWKVIDADGTRGVVALETAIRGTCAHDRLLDLVENFVAYIERPGGLVKVVARNHQILGRQRRDRELLPGPSCGRQAPRGVLAHPGLRQEPVDAVVHPEGAAPHPRRVDVRDGHRPHRARRPAPQRVRRRRGHLRRGPGARRPPRRTYASCSAADHRYVFTLIHKFRLDAKAGETTMPVLSDRSDVIVITDEAHRSQYDTLALNMRQALPNAAFMGFTGTPLIAGEELTRQQFGDYVSIYNFRDAIEDGATVPLYYENRIPELQLINDDFADELTAPVGGGRARRGRGRPARPPVRSRVHAADPARAAADRSPETSSTHFVGRGFTGKAMYVGVDKAAAVRMYELRAGGVGRAPGRAAQPTTTPCPSWSGRGWPAASSSWRRPTWPWWSRQCQNEIADLERPGPRHPPAPRSG